MKDFIKITDEFAINYDVDEYLVDKVYEFKKMENISNDTDLLFSVIDCESPIEQLLAIALEAIKIRDIKKYNPFIDIIDIEKQLEIKCGRNKYRVDFHIPVIYKNQGGMNFIVECDGYEFHQKTKEQVEYDNKRQRNLQKAGYIIIRFSGSEIWKNPYDCANDIKNLILSKCQYIKNDEPDEIIERGK